MRNRKKPGTNDAYVYIHIRLDINEVFYVGKGNGFYYQRAFAKSRRSPQWHAVAAVTAWRYEIAFDKLTKEMSVQKEIETIAKYKRICDGGTLVNQTLGGMGHLGLKGIESPNFGKPHTPERIENMRKAVLAAITPETRRKLSESAKKRTFSAETRLKLSIASKKRSGEKRKPLTEEHKKKVSEALKASYISRRAANAKK